METQSLSTMESALKAMTASAGFIVQTVVFYPPVILLMEQRE